MFKKHWGRENQQPSTLSVCEGRYCVKVQRPALQQGVGSSDPKWKAPNRHKTHGEDMVFSYVRA